MNLRSLVVLVSCVLCCAFAAFAENVGTATNDPNQPRVFLVYNDRGELIQSLKLSDAGITSGGNAEGIVRHGRLVFATGATSVTVLTSDHGVVSIKQKVEVPAGPVSVAIGNDHLYVATGTTAESYPLYDGTVGRRDGIQTLALHNGSTAQVGVNDLLYVTEKGSPTVPAGIVDVIALKNNGAIKNNASVTTIPVPAGSLTPFGFQTFGDDNAVITLAHSNQLGIYEGDRLSDVINFPEVAPCWMAKGKKGRFYTGNTGSSNISFALLHNGAVTIVEPIAGVTPGPTTDVAIGERKLAAISNNGNSLTAFTVDDNGSLTPRFSIQTPSSVNGVVVLSDENDD